MPKVYETYRGFAYPWLCDTMGHMNTQFYAAMYDTASLHFLSFLAPSPELKDLGYGWADVRQLIEYKHEVRAGSLLVIRSRILQLGNKSTRNLHEMHSVETGTLHSTCESVTVLFDLVKRASVPLSHAIRARAATLGADA